MHLTVCWCWTRCLKVFISNEGKALWKQHFTVQNNEHINCLYTPTGLSFIWIWECYVSFTFLLTVYSITASLMIILFVLNVYAKKSLTTDFKMAERLQYEYQIKERLGKHALVDLRMLNTRCLKVYFNLKRRKDFLEIAFPRQTRHFQINKEHLLKMRFPRKNNSSIPLLKTLFRHQLT